MLTNNYSLSARNIRYAIASGNSRKFLVSSFYREVESINLGKYFYADVEKLLNEVLEIHAGIRPDIFIAGTMKYTPEELKKMFADEKYLIYVAVDDRDEVLGYAFCCKESRPFSHNMVQFTSLFIDDLCVDARARGMHVGQRLFEHVKQEARKLGCYEVTLNVWQGNDSAIAFYQKMGLKVQEMRMEYILDDEKK